MLSSEDTQLEKILLAVRDGRVPISSAIKEVKAIRVHHDFSDQAAVAALTGILARGEHFCVPKVVASRAYEYAGAMSQERRMTQDK